MRFRRPRRVQPALNLTPLMDILFIVLIFLVLTTTFKDATTFQVQLPRTQTADIEPAVFPGLVTISVAEDGSVELAGEALTVDDLHGRLSAIRQPERASVRLRAAANVSHGLVVHVMDVVRRSGIRALSIETRTVSTTER